MNLKEELTKIISDYNLIDATFDSFWQCYKSTLAESPEDSAKRGLYNINSVNPVLRSTSYVISNFMKFDDENLGYIQIELDFYNEKNEYVGYYVGCFHLDGTMFDDFYVYE